MASTAEHVAGAGSEHAPDAVRRRSPRRAWHQWSPVLVFVGVLLVWQLFAVTVAPRWLPPLGDVGSEVIVHLTSGEFLTAGLATLRTLVVGLLVTMVIAGVVAEILALSDVVDEALTTIVGGLMAVPSVALIPIFIFIWGLSDTTMIVSIVSFALLPLTLQWATALREVPMPLVEMSRSFEGRPWQVARTIYVPSVAPLLLTGLRVAVVQGIKGVISAEVIVGTVGVGHFLTVESSTFDIAGVWSVIALIIVASIVSYALLSWLEHRASRWAD